MKKPSLIVTLIATALACLGIAAVFVGCAGSGDVEAARREAISQRDETVKLADQVELKAKSIEDAAAAKLAAIAARIESLDAVMLAAGSTLDIATQAGIARARETASTAASDIAAEAERLRQAATAARAEANAVTAQFARADAQAQELASHPHQPGLTERAAVGFADSMLPGLGAVAAVAIAWISRGSVSKKQVALYKGKAEAGVKVIDAVENLRTLEPSIAALMKTHADKLDGWMGTAGKALVDAVQKAGNDPLAEPVIS